MAKWILLFAIPACIIATPVPNGLTLEAWKIFAVYVAAILGLVLRPAEEPVVAITVVAFGSFLVPLGKLLSGYASTTVWLVFSAFLITQAFADTGLGRRIAYWMIGKFGRSALGVVYGATITDLILSPATPSNTARSGGIVYPIFKNIASTLGSEPGDTARKIGSFITLSTYTISLSTSALFITACAPNALTVSFAKNILKIDISWTQWMVGMLVPGLIVLFVAPWIIYKLYKPDLDLIPNYKELSEKGLQELGAMSSKEKILVTLFILAVVGWAGGNIIKIDGTAVALLFFACSAIFKLISWNNVLKNAGAWNTLIWYGVIIGLSGILAQAKFFTWLAEIFARSINMAGYSSIVVLGVLLIISVLIRYAFASMGAYVGAFIPVLFTVGLAANAPAMPLAFLIAGSSAYGCLLTHYGGAVGPVLFGTGYVDQVTWWKIGAVIALFNMIVYMTIGLGYWKLIGIW